MTVPTPKPHSPLLRGLLAGAGFGLAAATIEVSLWTIGRMRLGLATPRDSFAMNVAVSVVLGLCLGAALSPLLRRFGRRGWVMHLLAVFASWVVLGVVAGLPSLPTYLALTLVPWAVALLICLGASLLATRRPRFRHVPPIALFVLLTLAFSAPSVPALLADSEVRRSGSAAPFGAPDVLVVVLDTVRADHVSAYGYPRDTTPVFDSLAAEGMLFMDATAPATWSLPSHASLFTGVFPSTHGAHAEHRVLDPDAPATLAETLGAHGFETRCFTANAWFSEELGLVRGFDWSDEAWRVGRAGQTRLYGLRLLDRAGFGVDDNGGAAVVAGFEAWALSQDGSTPTFTFVNLIEAHFPYHQVPDDHLSRFTSRDRGELRALSLELMEAQFGGAPPDVERSRGAATDMYDAGVHYADHLLGRLVDVLRERGSLDETVLVVLSDHGELLGEHGAFGHGTSLYEEETRVPLLVRYPPVFEPGTRTVTPISTVGIFATIVDLAGVPAPPGLEVASLRAVVDGAPAGLVISERFALPDGTGARGRGRLFRRDTRFRSYRDASLKLVRATEGEPILYDLASVPGEDEDVASVRRTDVERLDAQLHALASRVGLRALDGAQLEAPAAPLDEETRERLRALGYLE